MTKIEVEEYEQTIIDTNISESLFNIIVDDPQAGLISKHLAENQVELYKIKNLPPEMLGAYVETQIRPKLKPNTPLNKDLPPPLDNPVQHGGAPSKETIDPLLDGVKFGPTYRKGE